MTFHRIAGALPLLFALLWFSTSGFQCSSPNVTSGKLYYQQYESSKDTSKLTQAMQAFEKEVLEKPNSAEGWYWIGFIHGIRKNYVKLHEAWEKSRQSGPQMQSEIKTNSLYFWGQAYNNGATVFRKAQIKRDKSLYAEAEQSFLAATLLEPDSSAKYGGYVNLAMTRIAQDKEEQAIEPLMTQNKLVPNPDAYRFLGQIMIGRANRLKADDKTNEATALYQQAIDILNEALVKFGDTPDINQELLNAYIAAGRTVEAKTKFKQYADGNSNDKAAQYAFGTVLLETKEYEEATRYLKKAIELDPKYENALYNLCVTYLRWGIQARDNTDPNATGAQASAFKKIIEQAVPHLKVLTGLRPDSQGNWDLAGKIYASLGMTKEAQEAYNKADDLRKVN